MTESISALQRFFEVWASPESPAFREPHFWISGVLVTLVIAAAGAGRSLGAFRNLSGRLGLALLTVSGLLSWLNPQGPGALTGVFFAVAGSLTIAHAHWDADLDGFSYGGLNLTVTLSALMTGATAMISVQLLEGESQGPVFIGAIAVLILVFGGGLVVPSAKQAPKPKPMSIPWTALAVQTATVGSATALMTLAPPEINDLTFGIPPWVLLGLSILGFIGALIQGVAAREPASWISIVGLCSSGLALLNRSHDAVWIAASGWLWTWAYAYAWSLPKEHIWARRTVGVLGVLLASGPAALFFPHQSTPLSAVDGSVFLFFLPGLIAGRGAMTLLLQKPLHNSRHENAAGSLGVVSGIATFLAFLSTAPAVQSIMTHDFAQQLAGQDQIWICLGFFLLGALSVRIPPRRVTRETPLSRWIVVEGQDRAVHALLAWLGRMTARFLVRMARELRGILDAGQLWGWRVVSSGARAAHTGDLQHSMLLALAAAAVLIVWSKVL